MGYRQERARLVLELKDSSDPSVQNTKAPVRTGRKWRADLAVDQAIKQAETPRDCWQDTFRENWPGVGYCSEDVVQSHKEGKERASDFRGGQHRGGDLSDQSP